MLDSTIQKEVVMGSEGNVKLYDEGIRTVVFPGKLKNCLSDTFNSMWTSLMRRASAFLNSGGNLSWAASSSSSTLICFLTADINYG